MRPRTRTAPLHIDGQLQAAEDCYHQGDGQRMTRRQRSQRRQDRGAALVLQATRHGEQPPHRRVEAVERAQRAQHY
jgi:hypothetical protein